MLLDESNRPLHDQTTLKDPLPIADLSSKTWSTPFPRVVHVSRHPAYPTNQLILLTILALLLVLSGLGLVIYSVDTEYGRTLHVSATAQALSNARASATSLSATQQVEQATAQVLATQQANIYATASAIAGASATASTNSASATATATAMQGLYTQDTSGTPAFNDPLSDNSQNHKWNEHLNSPGNTGCSFINGTYHALEAQLGYLQPCVAEATSYSNFVYTISMIIDHGTQGGILFRANGASGQYYVFRVSIDGQYTLEAYDGNKATTLSSGFSTAISTGIGQTNQLAVIADHNTLSLFVNQNFVISVTDSTFASGQIGVVALDYNVPADVEFSNAQVWQL
ncbi:MAG TPA: hypothetical protein VFA41_03985 [Ktedonobacteraceae bacterium]|jgi:hypothetical protein|nr:hypothetical protein [Ktedonobacteraceae bacterium]